MKKTNVLCIMDGCGHNPSDFGNAVSAAKKPNLDKLMADYPYTYIGASGLDVGLPDGQMGNSEVGHTNMGAGRVVYQELTRITKSIQDGDFFENDALKTAVQSAIDNNGALHLMGLMSDGGVHSHNTHLWALIELAKKMGLEKVYIHCIMDGRDVPPTSGKDYVAEAIEKTKEIGVGKVATVVGRYYAMDRDNNWDRVKKAYDALVFGEGIQTTDPVAAIEKSYETATAKTSPTSSFSRLFALRTRAEFQTATALFASTSAPTEQEKSQEHLLTMISRALREQDSMFTMFA